MSNEKNAPTGGPGAVCLEFADADEARAWDGAANGVMAAAYAESLRRFIDSTHEPSEENIESVRIASAQAAGKHADALLLERRKRSARIQRETAELLAEWDRVAASQGIYPGKR